MNYTTLNPLQPVPVPRFIPPRKRVPYHHKDVQKLVLKAFQGLLPSVKQTADKQIQYGITSKNSKTELQTQPADSQYLKEVIGPKLIAGHREITAMLKKGGLTEGVKSLLLNLRLPDPDCDIERYRFITNSNGSSSPYVCWAFENPDKPFIPIESVIAKISPSKKTLKKLGKNKMFRISRWKLTAAGALVVALILAGFVLKNITSKNQAITPSSIQIKSNEI